MKRNCLVIFVTLFCLILSGSLLQAKIHDSISFLSTNDIEIPTYICYRSPGKIIIDGDLSDWKEVAAISDLKDIRGDEALQPNLNTIIKMTYDESGLYVASFMEEPHIWSYYTQHDSRVCQENCFEVFIDLTGDTHNYLEYEINALGTDWDLFLTRPYRDHPVILSDWEFLGMQSAISVDGTVNNPSDSDVSWSVEIFIPWNSINQAGRRRGEPKSGDQIRMNFARVEWNTSVMDGKYVKEKSSAVKEAVKYWVWAPSGEVNMHCPELWGYVQFSEKVAGIGTDAFVFNVNENTKWILRQLYYKEKEYWKSTGRFTEDIEILGASLFCSEEQLSNLLVETTTSMFEITLTSADGTVWKIDEKGLIWSIP